MKKSNWKNTLKLLNYVAVLLLSFTQAFAEKDTANREQGEIPDWKARWELARTLSYARKLDESITQYRELLKEKPNLGQAKAEMGTVLFWKGKQEEALSILQQVPEKEMTPEARLARADIYASKGEYADAEEIYRKHLVSHPDADEVRLRLAETLSWARKYAESVKEYEAILTSRPEDIQVRRKYALVLSWMGQHEKAALELEKTLVKQNPE